MFSLYLEYRLVITYWLIQALTCSLTELLRRTGVETDISLDERCNLQTKECQKYIVNTLYGKSSHLHWFWRSVKNLWHSLCEYEKSQKQNVIKNLAKISRTSKLSLTDKTLISTNVFPSIHKNTFFIFYHIINYLHEFSLKYSLKNFIASFLILLIDLRSPYARCSPEGLCTNEPVQ